MTCRKLPSSKAKEAIRRTKETGHEHGFVICEDGETGDLLSGGETEMEIVNHCDSGDRIAIFHTHPNDNIELSDQDRRVLAKDDVEAVCVSGPSGKVKCERTKPTCESEFDA